jgi:O-antigen/teichoic acid export membrane protein
VTPDSALDPIEQPIQQAPSTAGMTTKVVKGSMWTLAGSVLPLAVSFISTPFIIRFLGAESYGVLLLVGLIPTYFSFADLGMGVASTKFASEAFGQGDTQKEAQVVWTATTIALIASLIVAIPILIFSNQIVASLNVPEHLLTQASIALRIAAVAFVLGIVGSVVNSPMLSRLRMDLNTITSAVPKILLAAVTPFILYLGGGIIGAVSWAFVVGVATLAVVVYFSGRLLPSMFRAGINRDLFRPLLKFGIGWFVAMVAIILMSNLEKFFVTKIISVRALAFYSIAFTLANIASTLPVAMTQSLLPAFSQLLAPERHGELQGLFSRTVRLNIIWLMPVLMIAFITAHPFLWFWAGPEFAEQSSLPFYVLLVGLIFNVSAYVPYAALVAAGKTGVLSVIYFGELVFYALVASIFIYKFGIVGAALAWSLRVTVDSFIMFYVARKELEVDSGIKQYWKSSILGAMVLLPPAIIMLLPGDRAYFVYAMAIVCCVAYSYLVWTRIVSDEERVWIRARALAFLQ